MNTHQNSLKLAVVALIGSVASVVAVACSSDDNAGPTQLIDAGSTSDSTTPGDDSGSSGSSSGSSTTGSSGSTSGSSGSGSSGSSGSGSGSSSSGGDAAVEAGALCNPSATVGGTDSYNTCSSFGCAGHYDNAANGVPNPLPSVP